MQTLESMRRSASTKSGGTSNDTVYRPILSLLDEQSMNGCVLDYGAGMGHLTSRIAASGRFTQVMGADLMDRPEDLAPSVTWHRQDLNCALTAIEPGSLDALVAVEVLEHLENPRATARDWFRLLKPGGHVVASTPNNESLRALLHLLLRGHFVLFADSCYPAHITALLKKDLDRILRDAGFERLRFLYGDTGGIPGAPRYTWQQLSFGVLRGRRWTDSIIVLARRPLGSHRQE